MVFGILRNYRKSVQNHATFLLIFIVSLMRFLVRHVSLKLSAVSLSKISFYQTIGPEPTLPPLKEKDMSSTTSELSPSKVWMQDALQSFIPLTTGSSNSMMQSRPSHLQNPYASSSPASAIVGFLENDKFLNPRYKTEICRNFKERSKCIYGDKCQFAHGRRELRDVVRNSKYKTKLCQKYWLVGYCAYGPRCNFLHFELETDADDCDAGAYTADETNGNGPLQSTLQPFKPDIQSL